jgi:polysaccharide biosynthesis protein PslG
MRRGVSAGLGVLVAVALVPSTATAMHLTETGTGTASVPWGFHEYFGYGAGGWSASLAAEQTERAAAILPASSASHFPIDWASVEREQGRYDWTIPDGIYAAMRAQSLEPVMVISNAPDWARDPAATCQAQRGCMFPPLAQHDDAWQAFVQAAVERFPDVTAVEVWNEPNIERFWAPQPDPARYVELLAAAHDAVAAAGSGAPVIVGGLVASPRTTSVPASDFLRQVYAQGCACDFEGIGSHPFPRVKPLLETMWNRLTNLTEVRDANGDSATPIWITEVGVTSDPNQAAGVTAEEQGDELIRLYRSIEGHNIAAFLIYRLIDDVAGGEGPFFAQMGVLSPDLEPKPAYCELGNAIGTACDAGPPETTIDSGPSGSIASNSASFSFRSSEPGSSFECRLDSGGWSSCGSPQSYGNLALGTHTFSVRAIDAAGNVDPSPATRSWSRSAPGAAVIQSGSPRSGTAASLATDDNSYYEVNSTTSGTRVTSWYGRFTAVPNSLRALRVAYGGRNSATCTQSISIWRWTTSSWVQLDSRSVGTTEALVELAPPGAPADYVSGTSGEGELRVRVRCTRSASFVARADLLRIGYDR